jgi:hypothetical protein
MSCLALLLLCGISNAAYIFNKTIASGLETTVSGSFALGVEFQPLQLGFIEAILFLKSGAVSQNRVCSLYFANQTLIQRVVLPSQNESTGIAWQTCRFPSPPLVSSQYSYVASVWHLGAWVRSSNYFSAAKNITSGPLMIEGHAGRYVGGSIPLFPSVITNINYWVDVDFALFNLPAFTRTIDNTRGGATTEPPLATTTRPSNIATTTTSTTTTTTTAAITTTTLRSTVSTSSSSSSSSTVLSDNTSTTTIVSSSSSSTISNTNTAVAVTTDNSGMYIGIGVGVGAAFLLFAIGIAFFLLKRRSNSTPENQAELAPAPQQYGELELNPEPEIEQRYGPPPSELRDYDKVDVADEFDSVKPVEYDKAPPPNNE